jgi:hypothetical protein
MLVHSVYFWLKPGLSPAERARFHSEVGKLAAIRSVEKIYVGAPASVPERSVTDRTFDVALTILFRDAAAHDSYQVDPLHVAFVDGNREAWLRVQVYDSGA